MSEEARLAAVLEVRLNRIDEKLSEYNRKIANSMRRASKDMEATNDNFAALFAKKPNLAKALDGVIDNTRLKVLDSGVARVGLLGSALEDLGPYGLAAAAAIGAVALALGQTRQAAAFADEIGDTAQRLHVTTDALQEYRYAVRLAGGEEKGADEALESFSVTLGKAQAGLPKAQKAFKELGFTKSQIDSFDTVEKGLKAVTERIAGLKTDVQKDAVIDQLGLTGMKPLIEEGVEEMQRLKREAQSLGVVMDAGIIKRAGEANDQFETLEQVISVQLKQAFVDLAPVLTGLLKLGGDLAREFGEVVASFQEIEKRSTTALQDKKKQLEETIKANEPTDFILGGKEYRARLQGKLDKINAELARREAENAKNEPKPPNGKGLIDLDAAKKAVERAQASQALIDDATKDELAARRALVKGILEQATLQAQEVDAEREKKDNKIRADLADDKITKAAANRALALNKKAADERKAAIAGEATTRLEQDRLSKAQELASVLDSTTEIYISLQRTVEARRKAELKLLEKQHGDRLQALYVRRDQAGRDNLPDDVKHINRLIDAENDNYALSKRQVNRQNLDPLADWVDRAPQSIAELNESFKSLEAQGLDSLNAGLAEALVNSQSLGAAAANVFKQLEVQILQILLQSGEAKVLGVLGFAGGGHVAGPGSGTSDSIPAMLSNGEFVVRAEEARKHRRLLEAINSGSLGHFAGGGSVGRFDALRPLPTIRSFAPASPALNFDLRGAVVTEDLLMQMQALANRARDEGAAMGARGGAALASARLHDSASRRLGR